MIEVMSVADYNKLLMEDAKQWLERAETHLRRVEQHSASARKCLDIAKQKYEQLRLDV